MAVKEHQKEPQSAPSPDPGPAKAEDVLRPFQEASQRFVQANLAAQETAVRQQVKTWLDFQDEVNRVGQETYRAVMDATRKQLDQLGQTETGGMEQLFSSRAQAQLQYEDEVRRAYADAQVKLTAAARKVNDASGGGDAAQHVAQKRQDAYKSYLSDLQRAWAGTQTLDPQTMNAIASHILSTMSTVSQAA